jgi:hypothetical protein
MTFRDTLERHRKEALAGPLDEAAVIEEWQKAVGAFMSNIEEFLEEYKDAIVFENDDIEVTEEDLGTYQVPQMTLRVGTAVLMIQPVGRLVIGGDGRVDLYRQGRSAQNDRVIALRHAGNSDSQWALSIPPEDHSFTIMSTAALAQSLKRIFVPFTKESLESALDRLLQ